MTYRAGDTVRLTGVVNYVAASNDDGRRHMSVQVPGSGTVYTYADSVDLVAHDLRVGDRVEWATGDCGTVVAVHDQDAWVKWDRSGHDPVYPKNLLRRVS